MQVVFNIVDVPMGTALMISMKILGGALFVSVDQSVFSNKLVQYVAEYAPSVNPAVVLGAGTAGIKQQAVDSADIPAVLLAYNDVITQIFVVGVAMAGISLIGSLLVEWKSVKGKTLSM